MGFRFQCRLTLLRGVRLLLAVAAVLAALSVDASATDSPPYGWMTVPTPDRERLSCANYSRMEWTVTMRNGSVVIEEGRARGDALPPALVGAPGVPKAKSGLHVLPVDDGYLVGGNAGEFGGGLTWFSADGKKSKVVHEEPVAALVPLGHDAALSFEGLNHLTIREGTVRWLERANGGWTTSKTAKLEEGPYAVVAGEHEAYVVGPESLSVVSFDGDVKKVQSLPLSLLYPSSMVREPNGTLWVGARQFVLRLVPQGGGQPFAVTWLVPVGCRTAAKRGLDCVCTK